MFNDPLFLLAAVASLIVAGILVFGIATFAKGGDFNKRNGNRIMRWRLYAQFVAVILIAGVAWLMKG
jgi:hypothetical protein